MPVARGSGRHHLGADRRTGARWRSPRAAAPRPRRPHRAAAGPRRRTRRRCRRRRDTRRRTARRARGAAPGGRAQPLRAVGTDAARGRSPATSRTSPAGATARPLRLARRAPRRARRDGGWRRRGARRRASTASPIVAALGASDGSPSVSVPVLSNTTVSISARRSSPSGALTRTPLREQPAGGGDLHGRHGQRQRAGAGDDEHGDGRGQRALPAVPGGDPAEEGREPQHVHGRRVEARGAVGEAHVAAAAPARPPPSGARSRPAACCGRWRWPR